MTIAWRDGEASASHSGTTIRGRSSPTTAGPASGATYTGTPPTVPILQRRLRHSKCRPLSTRAASSATETTSQERCKIRFSLTVATVLPVRSRTQLSGTT